MYHSGNAYYYRDSYLDQQIAFGVARSIRTHRFTPRTRGKKIATNLTQIFFTFALLSVTFIATYLLLDVLGLDHLTEFYGGDRLVYDLNRLFS